LPDQLDISDIALGSGTTLSLRQLLRFRAY